MNIKLVLIIIVSLAAGILGGWSLALVAVNIISHHIQMWSSKALLQAMERSEISKKREILKLYRSCTQ